MSVQNVMDLILILATFQVGTCYAPRECREKNGTGAGECAQGYGVCCVCKSFPTIMQLFIDVSRSSWIVFKNVPQLKKFSIFRET